MPQISVPDSPSTSLLDDATLNESERALISIFERERGGSSTDDPSTLTSAEELAEQTDTPGSTADSTAAPEPTTPVEGQVVGSESEPSESTEDLAGEAPTSVEGEPVADSIPTPAFTFAGVDYTSDHLARAVQIDAWYTQLNNPQLQAIDALLSGQYKLVPANEAVPEPTVTSPAIPPASSDSAITQLDDAGEWLDPRAEAEITRLRNDISTLREQFTGQVTPIVQQQQSDLLSQRLAAVDSAHIAFQTDYKLSDDQARAISEAVVQAGVLPNLIDRHGGDVVKATRAAYEQAFWTTPSLRDEYVRRQAAGELATLSTQQQAETLKQQKMSALANSGGSVPRRDVQPKTSEDRHSAMVEAIRADMGNGSV